MLGATADRLGGGRREEIGWVTAAVENVEQSVDVFCSCHLFLSSAGDPLVPRLTSRIFFYH